MKYTLIALLLLCISLPVYAGTEKESGYDRVMRTGTLRCGYILLAPEMSKDPNTGKLSGISYDVAEELGRRLHLKIDWAEEVNFGTMVQGLKSNHYDAVCFSLYRYSQAIPYADYSNPLFYSATGLFVRQDDHRFDKDIARVNDPSVTISTIDGEMSQFIAAEDFPKAKSLSMPQSTDLSQMMLNVETRKSDVAFVNSVVAKAYLDSHPNTLRNIAKSDPIRIFSHGFMFAKGEYDLVRMINLGLEEMHDQGAISKILSKYDPKGQAYIKARKNYALGAD